MTPAESSADNAIPQPTIVNGRFVPTHDVPFSDVLDQLIAEIRAGRAPNLGRFCSYCCTPLGEGQTQCPTCGTSTADQPVRSKISRPLAQMYTAKRKREGRYVHSAAWLGLVIGTIISIGLIFILPSWTKFLAVAFMIIGSYYIASYLGNFLVQDYAYQRGLRLFAQHWHAFIQGRAQGASHDE